MAKKIFKSFILLVMLVFVFALLITSTFVYNYYTNSEEKNLQEVLDVVSYNLEKGDQDFLEKYYSSQYRFTLVQQDGTVVYDSNYNPSELENHLDREEISEAIQSGSGYSERYSSTMLKKTVNYAKLLSNGEVIRVSYQHITVGALLLNMSPYILVIALFSIVLASFLSNKMAKNLVKPLVDIDIDNPMENNTYEEMTPILMRLNNQHQQIVSQMNQLKQKQQEFEQIISSMNEGLILLNKEGEIVSINDAAGRIFNVEGEVVGKNFLVINRDLEIEQAIKEALSGNHSELRHKQNDCVYQYVFNSIKNEQNIIGAIIICFDVTEVVYAQRNRQEFTANVSHELKTPLQSIMGSAELLESGLVKKEDEKTFYNNIRRESQRLLEMINDIILLSNFEDNTPKEFEQVNLLQLCNEVIDNLKMAADNKKVKINLEGQDCQIKATVKSVYEIIYNLVDNSIKYNKENGNVYISIKEEDDKVILSVSDDGIGIASSDLNRIFERFYRADKSHSKKTEGTGLGLSIVKHAVSYLGGTISVKSAVNKGTSFTVTFNK